MTDLSSFLSFGTHPKIPLMFTTRKLANTNGYIDSMFLLVDCGEFSRLHMPSQYPLLNTDKNISLIYTEEITVKKEEMRKKKAKKYDDVLFLQTKLLIDLNLLIKSIGHI
jgi:hypothetical protein